MKYLLVKSHDNDFTVALCDAVYALIDRSGDPDLFTDVMKKPDAGDVLLKVWIQFLHIKSLCSNLVSGYGEPPSESLAEYLCVPKLVWMDEIPDDLDENGESVLVDLSTMEAAIV